jgi:hypothetical protein
MQYGQCGLPGARGWNFVQLQRHRRGKTKGATAAVLLSTPTPAKAR